MMHNKRIWCVAKVDRATIIEWLTNHSMTNCAAFECEGYLFLNDQTCPDGAGEWGIFKVGNLDCQLESITFSWCKPPDVREYVEEALQGEYDHCNWGYDGITPEQLETKEQHGTCRFCA